MTAAESWRNDNVATPERLAAVRGHPAFRAAVDSLARTTVETYSGHPLLNLVASDRGRFVVAMLVVHLHHQGRLTAANLKTLAARQGFSSPGRTAALIALMRWAGYLAAEPGGRRLVPTDKFTAAQRLRVAGELAAVGHVSAAARTVSERLDDEVLLGRFLSALSEKFESGERLVDHAPDLAFCLERLGGFLVLNDLALRARQGAAPLDLSVSAYARRFSISRPHVHMVLREAQAGGLISLQEGRVKVQPALFEALDGFFTAVIIANSLAAEQALSV
jgi:hypothetical protein